MKLKFLVPRGNADAAFTFEITTALAGKICFVWKHGPGLWDNQQAPLVGRTPHRSISLDRRRHLKAMGPLAPPSGPLCLKRRFADGRMLSTENLNPRLKLQNMFRMSF